MPLILAVPGTSLSPGTFVIPGLEKRRVLKPFPPSWVWHWRSQSDLAGSHLLRDGVRLQTPSVPYFYSFLVQRGDVRSLFPVCWSICFIQNLPSSNEDWRVLAGFPLVLSILQVAEGSLFLASPQTKEGPQFTPCCRGLGDNGGCGSLLMLLRGWRWSCCCVWERVKKQGIFLP